jgi:hypothetical protein
VTLRVVAAVSLVLGVLALLGYLHLLGKGPGASAQMRHLRAMKDRARAPDSAAAYTLEDFAELPSGWSVKGYSAIERRGVTTEGCVQRVLRAMDGDLHLEIAFTPRAPGGPDTAYATGEITPGWRRGSSRWSYEGLLAAFRPNHGGATAWEEGPRRVRFTGWLLYDFQHDWRPSAWSLSYGAPRISGWEIHPVTRIELWDDSLRRYVDYPR